MPISKTDAEEQGSKTRFISPLILDILIKNPLMAYSTTELVDMLMIERSKVNSAIRRLCEADKIERYYINGGVFISLKKEE